MTWRAIMPVPTLSSPTSMASSAGRAGGIVYCTAINRKLGGVISTSYGQSDIARRVIDTFLQPSNLERITRGHVS